MVKLFLKEVATAKGHNLNYVILNSGVSIGTVRSYWHGKVERVDLDVIDRLCSLLDVDPGDIIRKVPPPPTPPRPSASTACRCIRLD